MHCAAAGSICPPAAAADGCHRQWRVLRRRGRRRTPQVAASTAGRLLSAAAVIGAFLKHFHSQHSAEGHRLIPLKVTCFAMTITAPVGLGAHTPDLVGGAPSGLQASQTVLPGVWAFNRRAICQQPTCCHFMLTTIGPFGRTVRRRIASQKLDNLVPRSVFACILSSRAAIQPGTPCCCQQRQHGRCASHQARGERMGA